MNVRVTVGGVPSWVDAARLLDLGGATSGVVDARRAADLAARLHGVVLGGRALTVDVDPPLPRHLARAGRTEEARRRRARTPLASRAVRLDDAARVGWTPEALADEIAAPFAGARVIDATAGAGGNTLAFARVRAQVTAIELDPARAAMLVHNLALYRVHAEVVVGDARVEVPRRDADLLWVDPPWGDAYRAPTVAADLPLVAWLADPSIRARFRSVRVKVPPSFDPASAPWATPVAVFGRGDGDARRVKMVVLCGDR